MVGCHGALDGPCQPVNASNARSAAPAVEPGPRSRLDSAINRAVTPRTARRNRSVSRIKRCCRIILRSLPQRSAPDATAVVIVVRAPELIDQNQCTGVAYYPRVGVARADAWGPGAQAVALSAHPQPFSEPIASSSAVSRPATAPPCSPANGPAARGDGRRRWGVKGSKIDMIFQMNDFRRSNTGTRIRWPKQRKIHQPS